jgi:hypothetical protein
MHVAWWLVRMTTVTTGTPQRVVHSSATRRCQKYTIVQCFHAQSNNWVSLILLSYKVHVYRTAANNKNVLYSVDRRSRFSSCK